MYTKSKTITFVVPAKDEEDNILNVFRKIEEISKYWGRVFIFAVDDGSHDRTFLKSQKYLNDNFSSSSTIIKNITSRNQGGVFKQSLDFLETDYVMILQGQDDSSVENLEKIFFHLNDDVDMVIPYQENWKERPFLRQALSRMFVMTLNVMFNLKLNYYNHSVLMKVKDVKKLKLVTSSYAYQAEIIIKLLMKDKKYTEVPVSDNFNHKKKTNAFRFRNIVGVAHFFYQMVLLRFLKSSL